MKKELLFLFICFPSVAFAQILHFDTYVTPPPQHVKFCKNFPNHCVKFGSLERVELDAGLMFEMQHVNSWVNNIIKAKEDPVNNDIWTYPVDGYGDCEDYVIKKRAHLIELGWPTSALLMTVVEDPLGRGHAVLMVRTKQGDFILDNMTSEIKLWNETGYKFYYRQSYLNPKKWVSLK